METAAQSSRLSPSVTRPAIATRTWHRFALVGILLLAVFLHFFRLEQEGYANLYYAAAVKSMLASTRQPLTSWHNFFFNSFDPGGFVTVDKPPLGLWVQAASAALFGFNGTSLLLPQAVAGVLSVLLLYHLVRRTFGPTAGLLAALALAALPQVDDAGMLLDPALLRARYTEVLRDVPPERVICYCGSGVTACHLLLAMSASGLRGAGLYVGSWSEWCRTREGAT